MREYAARENSRLAWLELGPRFDAEFVGFMDELMAPDVHLDRPDQLSNQLIRTVAEAGCPILGGP